MKLGKFEISHELIKDENLSGMIKRVMAKVIILQAESLYYRNAIEYVGISDLFEEVREGHEIPCYNIIISENDIFAEKL